MLSFHNTAGIVIKAMVLKHIERPSKNMAYARITEKASDYCPSKGN
jgi:hypothetical protein